MNFIEGIFGLAPDGGTGSLELLLIMVPIVAVLAVVAARRRARRGNAKRKRPHAAVGD